MVTSCSISPISYRSPLVRVIGSKEVLDAFVFFHGPTYSLGLWHFNCVDVVCGSMPPSSVSVSISCSCSSEGNFWPSRSFSATFCASAVAFCCSTTSFYASAVAFCCSVATFVASHASFSFVFAASFLLFSANYATRSFASSFFFCAADLSTATAEIDRARHSGSHDSSTSKITSSVAKYDSSFHFFAGSLRALM